MSPKPITKSKTMWFNLLTLLATIGGTAAQSPLFERHAGSILVVVSVLNMVLRLYTKHPIE